MRHLRAAACANVVLVILPRQVQQIIQARKRSEVWTGVLLTFYRRDCIYQAVFNIFQKGDSSWSLTPFFSLFLFNPPSAANVWPIRHALNALLISTSVRCKVALFLLAQQRSIVASVHSLFAFPLEDHVFHPTANALHKTLIELAATTNVAARSL